MPLQQVHDVRVAILSVMSKHQGFQWLFDDIALSSSSNEYAPQIFTYTNIRMHYKVFWTGDNTWRSTAKSSSVSHKYE